NGLCNVVAHEGNLVANAGLICWAIGRMDAEFGRRQAKNQPASTRIDRFESKYIAQHGAKLFGLLCVKEHVRADGCHRTSVGQACGEHSTGGAATRLRIAPQKMK